MILLVIVVESLCEIISENVFDSIMFNNLPPSNPYKGSKLNAPIMIFKIIKFEYCVILIIENAIANVILVKLPAIKIINSILKDNCLFGCSNLIPVISNDRDLGLILNK